MHRNRISTRLMTDSWNEAFVCGHKSCVRPVATSSSSGSSPSIIHIIVVVGCGRVMTGFGGWQVLTVCSLFFFSSLFSLFYVLIISSLPCTHKWILWIVAGWMWTCECGRWKWNEAKKKGWEVVIRGCGWDLWTWCFMDERADCFRNLFTLAIGF